MYWERWQDLTAEYQELADITLALSCSCLVLYTLQAACRLLAARKLHSQTFWNGCVISTVCLIFAVVLAIASAYEHQFIWKAEPVAAILLSIVLFVEGVRALSWHK